jgi:hypothetical protein
MLARKSMTDGGGRARGEKKADRQTIEARNRIWSRPAERGVDGLPAYVLERGDVVEPAAADDVQYGLGHGLSSAVRAASARDIARVGRARKE